MPAPRRLLGLLLALLLAAGGALPASALAQGAGDEQYQDPLAGEEEPPSTGGEAPPAPAQSQAPAPTGPDTSTSSGTGSGSDGTAAEPPPPGAEPAPVPAAGQEGAGAATAPSAREAGQLPRTGGDPVLAGALGAALLAAGTGVRVRLWAADAGR